jgi:hypothetical protein
VTRALALLLAAAALGASSVPAGPSPSGGERADLDKEIAALTAFDRSGFAGTDAPFAQLAARKPEVVHAVFAEIGRIQRTKTGISFVGRHLIAGEPDYALVTFPFDIELSTRSVVEVAGAFAGRRDAVALDGRTRSLHVIAAGAVGVTEVGEAGARGPVRVYRPKPRGGAPRAP